MDTKEMGHRLHDGLAQKLTAANMNLLFLAKSKDSFSPSIGELLSETIELLEDSISEAREISHQLINE